MMGFVSVVIPLYNKQDFIVECVESVLGQTHPADEIIIVDDGSTDDSMRILEEHYVGKEVHPVIQIVHQPNAGLSAARNSGISASRGEFILPLDADDWIDETYLEKTLPLMWSNIAIVATDMQRFGEQNQMIKAEPRTLEEQLESNMLPVTSLVRRKAIEDAGGYWPWGWEDWNLWIDILKRGWQVNVVNEPLFFYRVTAGGLNTDHTKQRNFLLGKMRERHGSAFRGV